MPQSIIAQNCAVKIKFLTPINVKKLPFINTVNGDGSKTAKTIERQYVNHTNIARMSMLVWLTLPFYDFCGVRSVAVNSVYKLQFFTFIFDVSSPVFSKLLIINFKKLQYIHTVNYIIDFSRWRPCAILDFFKI